MGKVYKSQDTEIKEKVGIKLIKPEISADKSTIERFQNELKFARKISHKNICRIYDHNKEDGPCYVTSEYVDGKNLKGMIRMIFYMNINGNWLRCPGKRRLETKQFYLRREFILKPINR